MKGEKKGSRVKKESQQLFFSPIGLLIL